MVKKFTLPCRNPPVLTEFIIMTMETRCLLSIMCSESAYGSTALYDARQFNYTTNSKMIIKLSKHLSIEFQQPNIITCIKAGLNKRFLRWTGFTSLQQIHRTAPGITGALDKKAHRLQCLQGDPAGIQQVCGGQ